MHMRRRGFSFIELMFAVVVMGIGMVAVAGALSVGTATVQSTFDESTAARVARSAESKLSHVMSAANAKSFGNGFVGYDLSADLKNSLKSQLVESSDRRFAWVPVYQRISEDQHLAQVVVVVMRCVSGGGEYTSADISPTTEDSSGENPPTLMPRSTSVAVADIAGGSDTITFDDPAQAAAVAPGTIIVTCGVGGDDGGRVFKTSELIDPTNHVWTLAPGFDCRTPLDGYTGNAFVFGRGYADPNKPAGGFAGASQAVAAYSMIINLH